MATKKKATSKKAAAKKSPAKKSTANKKPATKKKPAKKKAKKPSPEAHYRMIQEEAYFLAEKDGFRTGHEVGYWVRAERIVAKRLG